MCHFIDDISKCEISSFDKCPSDVRQFVDGLWESGLRVTPCLDVTDEITTTLSSPLPATTNPVDQTKLLAPGMVVNGMDSNQLPSRLTNVTNINSNDQQSLEVTVNNLTVNNSPMESVKTINQDDNGKSKPMVNKRTYPRFPEETNDYNDLDGFDQFRQFDVNNLNENNNDYDDDFEEEMKHSKKVRLHEVDNEGESRHDHAKKHRDIEEEKWSRVKEEFRRKMRESIESRESDESEYEEENEESDEDKNFGIFEDRKNSWKNFGPWQRNEEEDHKSNRKNGKNTRDYNLNRKAEQRMQRISEHEMDRQRKRKESERRREEEREERMREIEERKREGEERRREAEQRRIEEEQRRREEIEQNLERQREEAERRREDTKGWTDYEKIFRPQPWTFQFNDWREGNKNQRNHENENGSDEKKSNIRNCFKPSVNSRSSENHNSDDIMDLMCR